MPPKGWRKTGASADPEQEEDEIPPEPAWYTIDDPVSLPRDPIIVSDTKGLNQTLAIVISSRQFRNHRWVECHTFRRAYDRGTLGFVPERWRQATKGDRAAYGFV
jgi:hypothetical protein